MSWKELDRTQRAQRDVENFKKFRRVQNLGNLGVAGGMGTAAAGAYRKNPKMMAAGLTGAFLSGFIKGHAKKREDKALHHLARYYSLKDFDKVASMDKEAIFEWLAPVGAWIAQHVGAGALTAPAVGKLGLGASRKLTSLKALQSFGKKLTPKEQKAVAIVDYLHGVRKAQTEQMKQKGLPVTAVPTPKALFKAPLATLGEYFSRIGGPFATAGPTGEALGETAKRLEPWLGPKLTEQGLKAVAGGREQQKFTREVLRRAAHYRRAGQTLDSIIDEIPFARRAILSTGKPLQQRVRDVVENPERAEEIAAAAKDIVQQTMKGFRAAAAGAGVAGTGYLLSQSLSDRPKDRNFSGRLAQQLEFPKIGQETSAHTPAQMANVAALSPKPPMPSQSEIQQTKNVTPNQTTSSMQVKNPRNLISQNI